MLDKAISGVTTVLLSTSKELHVTLDEYIVLDVMFSELAETAPSETSNKD